MASLGALLRVSQGYSQASAVAVSSTESGPLLSSPVAGRCRTEAQPPRGRHRSHYQALPAVFISWPLASSRPAAKPLLSQDRFSHKEM